MDTFFCLLTLYYFQLIIRFSKRSNNEIFSIYTINVLLQSCSKVNFSKEFETIIGDYERVFSQKATTDIYTLDVGGARYGVRIKDRNKVQFFKDGKRVEVYKINEVRELTGPVLLMVKVNKDDNEILLRIAGDTLSLFTFPNDGYDYVFIKK